MSTTPPHDQPGYPLLARRLLILALPIVATMVSRTVMSFVDFVMVSQLGTDAQAAMMPAGITLFVLIGLGMGVMMAVSTFSSQCLGQRDFHGCSAYGWQGFYLSLAFGLLVLLLEPLVPGLYAMIGHDPGVQAMEVSYTRIGLLSIGPAVMFVAVSNFFTAVHRPMVALVGTVAGNVLNIVGNYALIYGKWGFPELGIAGAAWATTLATLAATLLLLAWKLAPFYRREFHTAKSWRPDWTRMKQLMRVGLPIGAQFAGDILVWMIFTSVIVGRMGTVALAAHNCVFKFLELAFMPGVGVGSAVSVAVGKAIGERDPHLANRYAIVGMAMTCTYMVLVGLLYVLMGKTMMGWLSDDAQVIHWGARILILCALFQLFDSMTVNYTGALRGAGDTLWPSAFTIVCGVVLLLGGSWLVTHLRPGWYVLGPWGVATLHISVVGLFMLTRWHSGRWRHLTLTPPQNC